MKDNFEIIRDELKIDPLSLPEKEAVETLIKIMDIMTEGSIHYFKLEADYLIRKKNCRRTGSKRKK